MQRSEAQNGSFVQDSATDSGDVTEPCVGFYVPDGGATIDRIEINDDDTTNVLTDYVKTSGGVLPAGSTVFAENGNIFTLVSMTAGAINPIKD